MKNTKYGFLFVFVCMFIAGILLNLKITKEDPLKKNANNNRDSNIAKYLTIIGSVGMFFVVLYILVDMSVKEEIKHSKHVRSMKKRNIGFKFY